MRRFVGVVVCLAALALEVYLLTRDSLGGFGQAAVLMGVGLAVGGYRAARGRSVIE